MVNQSNHKNHSSDKFIAQSACFYAKKQLLLRSKLRFLLCKMSQIIEHTGKIHRIDGDKVQVLITQNTACGACSAKSACAIAAQTAEKFVETTSEDSSFAVGDEVIVYGQQSLGLFAALLAFVIPILLILVILFVLRYFVENEVVSGTIALAILIPYYITLSFFRDKLKTKFQFYIRKA